MKTHIFFISIITVAFFSFKSFSQTNHTSIVAKSNKSKITQTKIEKRTISIYLPPAYNKNSKYKVIYFNDGQYLFKGGWHLENILDTLIKNKTIEPIIAVGIYSDDNRNSDLIPFDDSWIKLNVGDYTPKTKEYSDFIRKKIVPYIEKNYSILKGAKNRAFAGVSFGGLHTMWDGITHPDYWGCIIAMSPSLWVNNFEIFNYVAHCKNIKSKIWFDIGATTGEWNYYIPIIEILKKKKLVYGKDLFYYEDPIGGHDANSWSKRIKYPLILFAGSKNFTPKEIKIEIEVIKSSISNKYFQRINPIIYLENGLIFSASNQAKYELINIADGLVKNDGRFTFKKKKNLEVKISYKNFTKKIVINYFKIENQKKL